jgi:hypothetical protein
MIFGGEYGYTDGAYATDTLNIQTFCHLSVNSTCTVSTKARTMTNSRIQYSGDVSLSIEVNFGNHMLDCKTMLILCLSVKLLGLLAGKVTNMPSLPSDARSPV